jgi:hypothetical protein
MRLSTKRLLQSKPMVLRWILLKKTALKFAQNNLELAKAADVARVAQDLAVIGAMNSTDAFDRLTHAIVTGEVKF